MILFERVSSSENRKAIFPPQPREKLYRQSVQRYRPGYQYDEPLSARVLRHKYIYLSIYYRPRNPKNMILANLLKQSGSTMTQNLNRYSSTCSRRARLERTPRTLTLHVYDHCPFCIRVDLFLGWNNIKYNRTIYGYGDMEGPVKLHPHAKKQLPLLQLQSSTGAEIVKPESLDIIQYLQDTATTLTTATVPVARFPVASQCKELKAWEKKHKVAVNDLTRPRILFHPVDFASEEDKKYAIGKYTAKGFSYAHAVAREEEALKECELSLQEFDARFLASNYPTPSSNDDAILSLHGGEPGNLGRYGMDDIIYLPDLRKLTCVKGLKWPKRVRQYVDNGCRHANVETYDDWAI